MKDIITFEDMGKERDALLVQAYAAKQNVCDWLASFGEVEDMTDSGYDAFEEELSKRIDSFGECLSKIILIDDLLRHYGRD